MKRRRSFLASTNQIPSFIQRRLVPNDSHVLLLPYIHLHITDLWTSQFTLLDTELLLNCKLHDVLIAVCIVMALGLLMASRVPLSHSRC